MTAYLFGTGLLSIVPAGNNPTPVNVGVLKDVSLDASYTIKELFGQYQMALDCALSQVKITGKAKTAVLAGDLINQFLTGSSIATGSKIGVQGESGTIPSPSGPYDVTVTHSADWDSDYGVWSVTNGVWMTRVASTPATNEYAVTAGVYTFSATDAGDSVKIYYRYTAASTGKTVTYTNQLMGTGTPFVLSLFNSYRSNSQGLKLYSVLATKLAMGLKSDDFYDSDLDFQAFADANGNVMDVFTVN
jgi:hypothetical protein